MISASLVNALIIGYIGYSIGVGLYRGVFNIFIGIFGTYGACFLAWLFKDQAHEFFETYIGISGRHYPSLFFVGLWLCFYFLTCLLGKLLTQIFTLTGVGLIVRLVGGLLNGIKAVLIVILVLTFIQSVAENLYKQTDLTTPLIHIGKKMIRLYKENNPPPFAPHLKAPHPVDDMTPIVDDFQYNLIER